MKSTPFLLGLVVLAAFAAPATAGERKIPRAKIQVFTKLFSAMNAELDYAIEYLISEFHSRLGR